METINEKFNLFLDKQRPKCLNYKQQRISLQINHEPLQVIMPVKSQFLLTDPIYRYLPFSF